MRNSKKPIELRKLTEENETVKDFVEKLQSADQAEAASWAQPFAAAGKNAGKTDTNFKLDA